MARAASSSRGTKVTSKGVRGNPYHLPLPAVTAAAAAVRPWNAPSTAITRVRPVARRARRRAFSLASPPELTKNTWSSPAGAKAARRSAARRRAALGTALLWKKMPPAASASAASRRGWR